MDDVAATIAPWVSMILEAIPREYPNHLSMALTSEEDLGSPRTLHPAFYGSFDWHSSVHGHWSLARAQTVLPGGELRDQCLDTLRTSITPESIAGEIAYFERRPGFECPYGIAWLLLLQGELEAIGETELAETLAPLTARCETSAERYLERLTHPVRSGQHDQSAFALGLFLDDARRRGRTDAAEAVVSTADRLYGADVSAPLHFEPSNHDFLSPALAEADLMRRVRSGEKFAAWFDRFLPEFPAAPDEALPPIDCPDPSHGHLSHRIGLNLSRAWMLEGIARGLGAAVSAEDPRIDGLRRLSARHLEAGVSDVDPVHYAGAHWLGTFAIYATTGGSEPGIDVA